MGMGLTAMGPPKWVRPTEALPTPASFRRVEGRMIVHGKVVRFARFASASG